MKLSVTVAGETYAVEIEDVQARPVRARIDGELFEVWPEAPAAAYAPGQEAPAAPPPRAHPNGAARPAAAPANAVLAPLPGVVVSVAVKPGDAVSTGQPLLVLEAMKMNNTLRAARAGRVAAVMVTVGQTVRHRQLLLAYEPDTAAPP